jgi:transposase
LIKACQILSVGLPIVGAMRQELLSGGYIQADEIPVDVQSERTKGKNHQAYL